MKIYYYYYYSYDHQHKKKKTLNKTKKKTLNKTKKKTIIKTRTDSPNKQTDTQTITYLKRSDDDRRIGMNALCISV